MKPMHVLVIAWRIFAGLAIMVVGLAALAVLIWAFPRLIDLDIREIVDNF